MWFKIHTLGGATGRPVNYRDVPLNSPLLTRSYLQRGRSVSCDVRTEMLRNIQVRFRLLRVNTWPYSFFCRNKTSTWLAERQTCCNEGFYCLLVWLCTCGSVCLLLFMWLCLCTSAHVALFVWLRSCGSVCLPLFVWLCLFISVRVTLLVWLRSCGSVCLPLFVWLCSFGSVLVALFVYLCSCGSVCVPLLMWLCSVARLAFCVLAEKHNNKITISVVKSMRQSTWIGCQLK